jgi:uncharacterized membrane protein YeiH
VPDADTGVASGANNAIREIGGVFGVAVLASVFSAQGGYGSTSDFVDGTTAAVWVGAAVVLAGALAALALPRKRRTPPVADVAVSAEPQPVAVG